jgi:MoaA/NifB/PqqE/SkfB family radical SAM enzyme
VDKTFSGNKSFLGKMDLELFKKCIDEAREHNCRGLTLASRGEPTLHPQLGEFLRYCSPLKEHQFFDFKLNTNATRMDDDLCHSILESQVSLLVYSFDSDNKDQYEKIRVGGKFEKVFENIKKMKKIKQKYYPDSKLKTRVSRVLVDDQKIEDIEAFWSIYVDKVSLIINMPRWDTYNNPIMLKHTSCNIIWERMYVWHDGVCNPYDFDYKSNLEVGNAKTDALSDIWQFEKHQDIRKKHLDKKRNELIPCDRCPF